MKFLSLRYCNVQCLLVYIHEIRKGLRMINRVVYYCIYHLPATTCHYTKGGEDRADLSDTEEKLDFEVKYYLMFMIIWRCAYRLCQQ